MTGHIVTDITGGALTLRFNRADKKNALTTAMYVEAATALKAAEADNDVRVVVITGSGNSFSAGNDLGELIQNPPTHHDAPAFRFMHSLARFSKPLIAAVNGIAVGIGTTALLHCDFAYAVPTAKFQLPFVNLALVPEFASSLLLARHLGTRKATELLMLAEEFDAAAAESFGLINAVVPADQLEAVVKAKADVLAAKPPAALRATKALLRFDNTDVTARISLEAEVLSERLQSAELREAIAAFLEKRAPDFSKF